MEHIAWPLAAASVAIFALLLFKSNFSAFIDRTKRIGAGTITAETEQQTSVGAVTDPKPSGYLELMTATTPTLRAQEASVKRELAERKITDDKEVIQVLTRAVAKTFVTLNWEKIERVIFGSQLDLMIEINCFGDGLPAESLMPYYEVGKKSNPTFYEGFSFEKYLDFLVRNKLIEAVNNRFRVSVEGKEFLSWLVEAGRTHKRAN